MSDSTVNTQTPCEQVHCIKIFSEKNCQFKMVQHSLIFFAAINLILLYSATIASGKSLSRGKYLVDQRSYSWALGKFCRSKGCCFTLKISKGGSMSESFSILQKMCQIKFQTMLQNLPFIFDSVYKL